MSSKNPVGRPSTNREARLPRVKKESYAVVKAYAAEHGVSYCVALEEAIELLAKKGIRPFGK